MEISKIQSEASALTHDRNDKRNRKGALILAAFLAILAAMATAHAILSYLHHDTQGLFLGLEAATILGLASSALFYKYSSKEEQTVIDRNEMEQNAGNDFEMRSLNRARLNHEQQTLLNNPYDN